MPEWLQVVCVILGMVWFLAAFVCFLFGLDNNDTGVVFLGLFLPFFIPHLLVKAFRFWWRTLKDAATED